MGISTDEFKSIKSWITGLEHKSTGDTNHPTEAASSIMPANPVAPKSQVEPMRSPSPAVSHTIQYKASDAPQAAEHYSAKNLDDGIRYLPIDRKGKYPETSPTERKRAQTLYGPNRAKLQAYLKASYIKRAKLMRPVAGESSKS